MRASSLGVLKDHPSTDMPPGVHSHALHAARFGRDLPVSRHVPSVPFLTTSTACSTWWSRACCIPLPVLGFTTFQVVPCEHALDRTAVRPERSLSPSEQDPCVWGSSSPRVSATDSFRPRSPPRILRPLPGRPDVARPLTFTPLAFPPSRPKPDWWVPSSTQADDRCQVGVCLPWAPCRPAEAARPVLP
jgi:hypothetical protein